MLLVIRHLRIFETVIDTNMNEPVNNKETHYVSSEALIKTYLSRVALRSLSKENGASSVKGTVASR
jgi:hypothetical protein